MGALAAIVHWDGRPLSAEPIAAMGKAAAYRSPEGVSVRTGERIALALVPFGTTPDAAAAPLVDPERGLWFVFDGRLDNRDELRKVLAVDDTAASDAALARAAFVRWSEGTAAHLLGDFAFVAWDDRRRRLVASRDHLGVRALHFHAGPAHFVCATDLAQVLAHPAVPREPDPSTAADYLAGEIRNGPGTLFRGISRVPPGHTVIADDGRVRLERYWSAEPATPLRYRCDEEYAAHCRDLLIRSVAARLRSDRPVAAMLSGGLDSSAVVCIAHRVLRAAPPPRPFSMIYPDHPESDERLFLEAVAAHCGTTAVQVVPGPITGDDLQRQAREWASTPSMPADEMANTLYAAMREQGHRVALTGAGGDFLFSGSPFQYADRLRRGHVKAVVRSVVDDWRAGDTVSPRALLQAGVWPLLPRRAKTLLRPLARRVARMSDPFPWLRLDRRPDAAIVPDEPRGDSYATEDVTRQLASGMHAFFLDCAERSAARRHIELRHPFLDVRLVQFALDIPDDQRLRGRFTKFVLREALGGDLPDIVRSRRTKGDFAHAVVEAIEALGGIGFFRGLRIDEAGWVDGDMVAAKYRLMQSQYPLGPDVYGDHVPTLWMIAAVELWFRENIDSRRIDGATSGPAGARI